MSIFCELTHVVQPKQMEGFFYGSDGHSMAGENISAVANQRLADWLLE